LGTIGLAVNHPVYIEQSAILATTFASTVNFTFMENTHA